MGLELLAAGRRRKRLEGAFDSMIEENLEGRVAVFDRSSAEAAARVAAERRQAGRPVDFRDVEMAGIAIARKASLATRNVQHFEGLGLELLDPWSGA
jgi:predicted nucleic acid-binding protein